MTLSKRLRDEVCKKLGISSNVQLWRRVNKFAVERKITDRDVALLLLAHEQHIDVRKPRYHVPQKKLEKFEEELKSQRSTSAFPVVPPTAQPTRKGARISAKQIVIEFPKGVVVTDPLLPKKLVDEAIEMANVYPIVYVFENSVRNLVSTIMSSRYTDKWWEQKIGATIKKRVQGRIEKEDKNRWHGRRGAHPIFYTDIDDLKSIITTYWSDFEDIYPSQQWLTVKIEEIELSRNVVAHNNPLDKDDIARLTLDLKGWIKQISRWTQKGSA